MLIEKNIFVYSKSFVIFELYRWKWILVFVNLQFIGGSFMVTLVVDWWFWPEFFCRWPMKAIYQWVEVDEEVILLRGGGDTWPLFCEIKLFWTFELRGDWSTLKGQIMG